MPKYSLTVRKDDQLDTKHSKSFDSKKELKDEYKRLCKKYHAKEIGRGLEEEPGDKWGLSVFSKGSCEHGKKVEITRTESKKDELLTTAKTYRDPSSCNII